MDFNGRLVEGTDGLGFFFLVPWGTARAEISESTIDLFYSVLDGCGSGSLDRVLEIDTTLGLPTSNHLFHFTPHL